jgi:hypothetical protein
VFGPLDVLAEQLQGAEGANFIVARVRRPLLRGVL